MSGPIERFRAAKEALWRFDRVHSLIGKRYGGGGGGVGSVINARFAAEVYHQEYDGARNYHDVTCGGDERIAKALDAAAQELSPKILSRGREILADALRTAAAEAKSEAESIVAATGGGAS